MSLERLGPERPWRGDPADIVAAGDLEPGWLRTRIAPTLPPWRADAACAGTPTAVFFPERGGHPRHAMVICGGCPVRHPCLAEALDDPDLDHGVRGGLTARQRRALRHREQRRG